jgi:N6-adenosine-specific RNA methylase IME4
MSKKFSVIVCDPPWKFSDKLQQSDVKRGAAANYNTMSISDIKQLPVKMACHPDGAVLCLWVPSSLLQEGLDVMSAWGFFQKQVWVWIKIKKDPFAKLKKQKKIDWDKIDFNDFLSFGMGHLGRNVHEIVLVGTCGKISSKVKNKSQRTVFFYENTKHSKKPELLQDKLELMFPGVDKLELFARRQRKGWCCLGNEVGEKLDIKDSLAKL